MQKYGSKRFSPDVINDDFVDSEAFPSVRIAPLNNVISQGMNPKKKHEVEALAAVIGSISRKVGANTIVDVGSGQSVLSSFSFDKALAKHEDIDDAVGSEEPTECDHGVDLQQPLLIKIDSSDSHKK
ncbi:hypothetical protein OROMI_006172 [Orobanche minor]